MLECASPRLCEPGMPHHRAPDKRPDRRLAMIEAAGRLRIPFTTGILVGIGETRRERVESLLAIRRLHRAHGHVQEVIVQNFRAVPGVPMAHAPEPDEDEVTLVRRDGAPRSRRRRLGAGAAEPEPRRRRSAARGRAERLRRDLAGHARLHQPASSLAARRRASGDACAQRGLHARGRAPRSTSASSTVPASSTRGCSGPRAPCRRGSRRRRCGA